MNTSRAFIHNGRHGFGIRHGDRIELYMRHNTDNETVEVQKAWDEAWVWGEAWLAYKKMAER